MTLTMDMTELEKEVAALKERLEEAEAVCHAISTGEVDGVVAGASEEQKRVLLMSGAYTRYRQIVEDMAQGAVTLSSEGEILFANHSFARMLGENLIDLFRMRLESLVGAKDVGKVREMLRARIGQPDVELRLRRRDGATLRAQLSLVTASDNYITLLVTELPDARAADEGVATLEAIRNGSLDGFVIDGDVRLLATAQEVYRNLAQRMEEGAVAVAPGGAVLYVNERFADMVGAPTAHILGQPLAAFVVESHLMRLGALLTSSEGAEADIDLRRGNGKTTSAHVKAARTDGNHLLLFTDVTLQKRHEASDERTRRFLGMLAHEFRNILGPISNATQLLKRSPELGEEAQKAVSAIERQHERLLGLVEDLLRINPKE